MISVAALTLFLFLFLSFFRIPPEHGRNVQYYGDVSVPHLKKKKSYVGLTKSYAGDNISYVGDIFYVVDNKSYVGDISYVEDNKSYVGDIITYVGDNKSRR